MALGCAESLNSSLRLAACGQHRCEQKLTSAFEADDLQLGQEKQRFVNTYESASERSALESSSGALEAFNGGVPPDEALHEVAD